VIRLQLGSIAVREWQAKDAGGLALQANDRRVWIHLRDVFPHPYGIADAHRFIGMVLEQSPPTHFAIEAGERLAGGIGYTLKSDVERVSAEVGYWLGHAFWGQGIGTTALRLVTRHAFAVHQELRRLHAVPFAGNQGSARVLEKAGYRREGTLRQSAIKDGRVLDQWMYAILREECPPEPGPSLNQARLT
jgi:RimJ/RimL family protein N-acetyltransferase